MKPAPIGTPVYFFRTSSPKDEPICAFVTDSWPSGACRLSLLHKNGDIEIKQSCHHISSQFLRDDSGALTEGAKRNGAWDYHPWFKPPVNVLGDLDGLVEGEDGEESKLDHKVEAKKLSPEQRERKVIEIMNDGDQEYVYKRAKFWGVSRDELAMLYEKHGKLVTS